MLLSIVKRVLSKTRNQEAKVVIGNFVWLSVIQVAGYVFPLITLPYLANIIGVDGFGKIAFATAIMVWIQTIADWGFNLTAARDVAQNRDDWEKVSFIFSNILWARFLLMFLSFVVLTLLIIIIPSFRDEWDIILVSFLMIPGHILFPDWFFQAIEKMKYITILNLLTKFIFTIAVFIFIKKSDDYILQPLFISLGYLISGSIAMYYILIKWKVKLVKPVFGQLIQTIKSSTNVFLNNLLPNLYNSFSTMLLGVMKGDSAVGILDGGNKFVYFGNQLILSMQRAFYPYLSRRIDKHHVYVRVSLVVSAGMAIFLFIGASFLVNTMLSPEFSEAKYIIQIRSISMVFFAMSGAYGANYLIIKHKECELRKITMWCSAFGFVIAWPLVYYFGYIGASLTVTLSLMLLALFSYRIAKK